MKAILILESILRYVLLSCCCLVVLTINPGWDEHIIKMAIKSLLRNNVEMIVGSPIKEITQSAVILQSGRQIGSDLTIWAAGIKGFDVKTTSGIERSKTERIFVDNYSRVKRFENVFAIGDITAFTLPGHDMRRSLLNLR